MNDSTKFPEYLIIISIHNNFNMLHVYNDLYKYVNAALAAKWSNFYQPVGGQVIFLFANIQSNRVIPSQGSICVQINEFFANQNINVSIYSNEIKIISQQHCYNNYRNYSKFKHFFISGYPDYMDNRDSLYNLMHTFDPHVKIDYSPHYTKVTCSAKTKAEFAINYLSNLSILGDKQLNITSKVKNFPFVVLFNVPKQFEYGRMHDKILQKLSAQSDPILSITNFDSEIDSDQCQTKKCLIKTTSESAADKIVENLVNNRVLDLNNKVFFVDAKRFVLSSDKKAFRKKNMIILEQIKNPYNGRIQGIEEITNQDLRNFANQFGKVFETSIDRTTNKSTGLICYFMHDSLVELQREMDTWKKDKPKSIFATVINEGIESSPILE